MTDSRFAMITIAVAMGVTVLVRFLPFLLLRGKRETPAIITYFGKVLPYATMAMLVVFCLKGTKVLSWPYGLPELIAGGLVVGLHAWKHNTLLSIIAGTVCYMLLIQMVFV